MPDDDLTETKVTFALARLAAEQGAPPSFFTHLGNAYTGLNETNDYDLDIDLTSAPAFTPMFNGNGLEAANEDESVEETYFRLIIESPFFDHLEPDERELFLLTLAQECIGWALDRKVY